MEIKELKKLEKYIELLKSQDQRIKDLKKENKQLKESLDAYSSRCILCGTKKDLTKHSLVGKHKFPFVVICRKHHNLIEGIKEAIRSIKGEENSSLSVTRFKKMIKTFDTIK